MKKKKGRIKERKKEEKKWRKWCNIFVFKLQASSTAAVYIAVLNDCWRSTVLCLSAPNFKIFYFLTATATIGHTLRRKLLRSSPPWRSARRWPCFNILLTYFRGHELKVRNLKARKSKKHQKNTKKILLLGLPSKKCHVLASSGIFAFFANTKRLWVFLPSLLSP